MLTSTESFPLCRIQPIAAGSTLWIGNGGYDEIGRIPGRPHGHRRRESGHRSGSAPPFAEDKTPWVYGSRGRAQTIDGDIDRPTDVAPVTDYTFDLGLPIPLYRVVFFPPETGRTTSAFQDVVWSGGAFGSTTVSSGLLIKDQFPRQYSISGSLNEQEFLFQSAGNDLDIVLGSSLNHTERVADVHFPTEVVRFTRVRFPLDEATAGVLDPTIRVDDQAPLGGRRRATARGRAVSTSVGASDELSDFRTMETPPDHENTSCAKI